MDQFELVFNKKSKDGSTKANIRKAQDDSSVYGVIQRINEIEKIDIDRAEGLGYGYELVFFEMVINGENLSVGYYIAKDAKYLTEGKPYDWYFNYVRFGALENQFPEMYLKMLHSIEYGIDSNEKRRKEHDQVLANHR